MVDRITSDQEGILISLMEDITLDEYEIDELMEDVSFYFGLDSLEEMKPEQFKEACTRLKYYKNIPDEYKEFKNIYWN